MIQRSMGAALFLAGVCATATLAAFLCREPGGTPSLPARLRQPAALVVAEQGRRLFVANRRSGTVSTIDVEGGRVIAEIEVGRLLADLIDGGDGRLLAVAEGSGELIVLDRRWGELAVVDRVRVGEAPVRVCRLSELRAVVACLWPRQLVFVDVSQSERPRVRKTIPLPFAPRCLLALPGGEKLVVADAFGGQLAVLDCQRGDVASVRSIPGHNIRSLALSTDGKQLLLSHQVLSEDTPTRADDVRWGNVLSNMVRALAVQDVARAEADLLCHSRSHALGEFRHGAADPAGLVVADGKIAVALAGTGEVAFGAEPNGDWKRLRVGIRPTALARAGSRLFVADTFGDAVVTIDMDKREKIDVVSLGTMPHLQAADRGERLFYDGRMSVEGWMSCHSCHSDGHTNGFRSDTFGDGSYGAPKRVPTLRGVADTGPWAWNGGMARLEDQIRQSVQTTMRGPRPTQEQIADLIAYLRTLPPPPPLKRAANGEALRRGETVFRERGCTRCHTPPLYTTTKTYEVGLKDEAGNSAFNPPSLRGIGHGVAFFHDGRATRLEEVFTKHHHQVPNDMPRQEVNDLLAFLRSL